MKIKDNLLCYQIRGLTASPNLVLMRPGAIPFTLILSRASSEASDLVKATKAVLLTA